MRPHTPKKKLILTKKSTPELGYHALGLEIGVSVCLDDLITWEIAALGVVTSGSAVVLAERSAVGRARGLLTQLDIGVHALHQRLVLDVTLSELLRLQHQLRSIVPHVDAVALHFIAALVQLRDPTQQLLQHADAKASRRRRSRVQDVLSARHPVVRLHETARI